MNSRYARYYTFVKPFLQNKIVRTYSSASLTLVAIMIFGLFAIKPTLSTIVSLQKSISQQQLVLQQLDTKIQNLSDGKKNYENMDTSVRARVETLVPDSTSIADIINNLNLFADSNQASISGLQFQPVDLDGKPQKITKQAQIKEVGFTINLQGSYTQLSSFLKSLVRANRLISINSVSFNKTADGPLIMSVNAKGYYIK